MGGGEGRSSSWILVAPGQGRAPGCRLVCNWFPAPGEGSLVWAWLGGTQVSNSSHDPRRHLCSPVRLPATALHGSLPQPDQIGRVDRTARHGTT